MFEARFLDAATFKKLVEALRDFKEINLECQPDGVHMKVMDECHVSLAHLYLAPSVFHYYHCDAPCKMGINVENLAKIIRLAPNDRALSLRLMESPERLSIESDVEPETGLRRAADLPLVSVRDEPLQIPERTYQVEVELPTKLYANMIKDFTGIAEDVRISVSHKTVKFEADGDKGRVENVFHRGEGVFSSTHWSVSGPSDACVSVEQTFALRFLIGFAKACPLSDTVVLALSPKFPFRLQFSLGDESFLAFYVAPALD